MDAQRSCARTIGNRPPLAHLGRSDPIGVVGDHLLGRSRHRGANRAIGSIARNIASASDDAGEGAGATARVVEAIGSAGVRAETADCLAASLRVQAAHLDGEIRQLPRDVRRPNGRSAAAERRRRGPTAAASSYAVIARDDGERTGEAAILVRNNSYISAI
jgi:hypothetical protein